MLKGMESLLKYLKNITNYVKLLGQNSSLRVENEILKEDLKKERERNKELLYNQVFTHPQENARLKKLNKELRIKLKRD